jgi:hypothetical protein
LALFAALVQLMRPFAAHLDVKFDEPGHFHLDTLHVMKNKQPLFFGAVKIASRYVSYHLMPVYVEPKLLAGQSPALLKRMQGKSCFNFTREDRALFIELQQLSVAGFNHYVSRGYVSL